MKIRRAELADLEAMTEIYNEAILTSTATFDLEPKTVEERLPWFESHDERFPILVAECDEEIAGWACLSRWRTRKAYERTAETSFYVKGTQCGKGIGRQLKQAIIDESRRLNFHTLIAGVSQGNEISLHLNKSFGFEVVGTFREVGYKFDQWLDVTYLQLMLD